MSRLGMIAIGQYVPRTSFIHRLDPRTKIVLTVAWMAMIFLANNFWTYVGLVVFILLAFILSKIPVRFIWRGLKPVWWLLLFTMLMHIWLTKEGDILWQWGVITVHEQGLLQGLTLTLRIALLVLGASLLTLTTQPLALTDGLEKLLYPLHRVRFPVHEFALMLSIALRFIPTLLQEVDRLIKAQEARGGSFSSGSFTKRVLNIISILVPLFISAFQKADDLALAMEARAYRGGQGRTHLRALVFKKTDLSALISSLLLFVFILCCRNW